MASQIGLLHARIAVFCQLKYKTLLVGGLLDNLFIQNVFLSVGSSNILKESRVLSWPV